MFVGNDFSPIEPGDVDTFTFDVTAMLGVSTIASVDVELLATPFGTATDNAPASRLIGSANHATANGITTVSQDVGNCLDGVIYLFRVTVTTTDTPPRVLSAYSHIPCRVAA
ncbi:MAG TPA: hypothetical protein VFA12_20210 [Stellaceae bacterium]|nr:hypothetical protein [Stellaceae bacterium]